MSVGIRGRRLRGAVGVAAVGLGIVVAVGIGMVVRGVFLGETLASGDGWQLQAKWSPFGSSITYREEGRSGGVGGLARPGDLTEVLSYVPPEGSAIYFVGVLPEDAITVRAASGVESSTMLHQVVVDDFYVVRVDGVPSSVRLEAMDAEGQVVDAAEPPTAGPPAGEPPH